jgi:hypothetical protein
MEGFQRVWTCGTVAVEVVAELVEMTTSNRKVTPPSSLTHFLIVPQSVHLSPSMLATAVAGRVQMGGGGSGSGPRYLKTRIPDAHAWQMSASARKTTKRPKALASRQR